MAPSKPRPVTNVATLPAVYNIFITASKPLARRFSTFMKTKSASYEAFQKSPACVLSDDEETNASLEGVYLSTADMNVLEFTHSFNFGEGSNADNQIKLKTFEPGLEVLKRLFFLYLQEEVGEIKFRKDAIKRLLDKENAAEREFLDADESDYVVKGDLEGHHARLTRARHLTHGKLEDAREELTSFAKANAIGQRVFIAYGVGDNLDEWAGPLQAIMGKLDYNNDGKEETVTYSFHTDHASQQFDQEGNLRGNKDFDSINFVRPTIPFAAYDYEETGNVNQDGRWGSYGKGVPLPGYTPSLHDTIVKLISYYLYNLGIKNHLVVLPNLDLLLATQVSQSIGMSNWHRVFGTKKSLTVGAGESKSESDTLKSEEYAGTRRGGRDSFANFGGYNYAMASDNRKDYTLDATEKLLERTRRLYVNLFSPESTSLSKDDANRLGVHEGYVLTLKEKIDLVFTVFKRLGLRTNKSEERSSDEDPALVNYLGPKPDVDFEAEAGWTSLWMDPGVDVLDFTSYDVSLENQYVIKDPFVARTTWADAVITLELPFQHLADPPTSNGEYMNPIVDIVGSIIGSAGQSYIDLTYFWENDVKLVDLFKSKFGSGTFEGYTNNIKDPLRGVKGPVPEPYKDNYFIFGDQELIDLFLYGGFANVVDFNKQARLKATRAWEGIPIEFSKEVKSGSNRYHYFLDPFWNRIKNDLELCTQTDVEVAYGAEGTGEALSDSPQFATRMADGTYSLPESIVTPINPDDLDKKLEDRFQSDVRRSYFSKAKSLVTKPWSEMGHFSEYDLDPEYRFEFIRRLPDEFAFLNDTKDPDVSKAIKDIFEMGPAFFVANDAGSNVLSYSFDNNQFIFTQFFGTIREIYYSHHARYSKQLAAPILGEISSDAQTAGLYAVLDRIGRKGYYGNAFSKIFKGIDLGVDKGRMANDLSDIIIQESTGLDRYVARGRRSAIISMITLFMSLFKYQYRGHITSLPMFNICNMGALNKPSLVLIKSANRVKAFSEQNRSTADFFSGLYRMLGFKHTITKDEAKSEFIMYKDMQGILNSETDEE